MYYQPLSFCIILKQLLEPIQSYEDVPFSGPKWPICPEQKFFGTNHCYYFHLPIGPFYCPKFKNILTTDLDPCTIFGSKVVYWIQNYGDAPFLDQKWSICPKEIFFWKIITIILIYLLAPQLIVQNLKKILPVDREL